MTFRINLLSFFFCFAVAEAQLGFDVMFKPVFEIQNGYYQEYGCQESFSCYYFRMMHNGQCVTADMSGGLPTPLILTSCFCLLRDGISSLCGVEWMYDETGTGFFALTGVYFTDPPIGVISMVAETAGNSILIDTSPNSMLYSRDTREWRPRNTPALCVQYNDGPGPGTFDLQPCDGSDAQKFYTDFAGRFAGVICFSLDFAYGTCMRKDGCTGVTCGDCEYCRDGSCVDITDDTEPPHSLCCDCDLSSNYCDFENGCQTPCLETGCGSPPELNRCELGCTPDLCAAVEPCPEGQGCWTNSEDVETPSGYAHQCLPNPCDDVTCVQPNMECVLVGTSDGDQVPVCQCEEDYEFYCADSCTYVLPDVMYRGSILQNHYDIPREECCYYCIMMGKCGFWSHHDKNGHCKLFAKWRGLPSIRIRKGWSSSSLFFIADDIRFDGGQFPPDDGFLFIYMAPFIYDAESLFWMSSAPEDAIAPRPTAKEIGEKQRGLKGAGYDPADVIIESDENGSANITMLEEMPHSGSCKPKGVESGCYKGDQFCHCDPSCVEHGDCCEDYFTYCTPKKN